METVSTGEAPKEYAGFWLRFVAVIIDSIILQIVNFIVIIPILGALGFGFFSALEGMETGYVSDEEAVGMAVAFASTMGAISLLTFIVQVLYYTLMQSSAKQATLGKMALGLKVTDMEGNRLDFGKSLVRELCKIISSAILMIGYIMAGFTEKKQALHDIIPGTLVVKG